MHALNFQHNLLETENFKPGYHIDRYHVGELESLCEN